MLTLYTHRAQCQKLNVNQTPHNSYDALDKYQNIEYKDGWRYDTRIVECVQTVYVSANAKQHPFRRM